MVSAKESTYRDYAGAVNEWPDSRDQLVAAQEELGAATPSPWQPSGTDVSAAGCFICFERGLVGRGAAGDRAWVAAALFRSGHLICSALVGGGSAGSYEPALLALREGPLLEAGVRSLPEGSDVLLVNATGRDHPRRAGLALQLGARLELPSVGVTDRPLLARGEWPRERRGERSPLLLEGKLVGYWLRTRRGRRPLAVHAGWRTDADTAVEVVLRAVARARTPEPLRAARTLARSARTATEGAWR
jgi:deoxyribonuclease V